MVDGKVVGRIGVLFFVGKWFEEEFWGKINVIWFIERNFDCGLRSCWLYFGVMRSGGIRKKCSWRKSIGKWSYVWSLGKRFKWIVEFVGN